MRMMSAFRVGACRAIAAVFLCAGVLSAGPGRATQPRFRVGTIRADAIRECSGLAASRKHPGVFWTINDSDNAPVLYAITREGELIREYPVRATNTDWEDIAIDDAGQLYIADTGNNELKREEVSVYRVDEPDPHAPLHGAPEPLRVNATWRLEYPGKPFDCESLFVLNGKAYVLPKRLNISPAEICRFDVTAPPDRKPVTLEHVCQLPAVRAPVTAADVSPDGKQLAVLTVLGPYIFEINNDIANAAKAKAVYSRYIDPHMEAACFVPEGLLTANETRQIYLFRDANFTPVSK